jgi:hypothetical protein
VASNFAFWRFDTPEVLWRGVLEFTKDREPEVIIVVDLDKDLGLSIP